MQTFQVYEQQNHKKAWVSAFKNKTSKPVLLQHFNIWG